MWFRLTSAPFIYIIISTFLALACTDLFVVLQNSVDVFQLGVVGQKVNLMEVVVHFFPVVGGENPKYYFGV